MSVINVLDKSVCELIAAGEVVERPASVVKELIENAIDAGASSVEVELRRSGLELIRVSDNGCGIAKEEVPTAFLRHATSKIRGAEDLDAIGTLGFRGEALAAICAVSRVRLVTKRREDLFATEYRIEGGEGVCLDEVGAPDGTSVYVADLFYNTPARMKFLKKDVFEGNAVQNVVEQQALANPHVAFKLIRDGRPAFSAPGTGDLLAAAYSVLPREVAGDMLVVAPAEGLVQVSGLVSKPRAARASRSFQYLFVNDRFIKSKTLSTAVEEACRGLVMVGKYPCFVLNITMPLDDVDINVHPAKTEVRFRNSKEVFSAVYSAVKAAVSADAVAVPAVFAPKEEPEAVATKQEMSFEPAPSIEKTTVFSTKQADNVPVEPAVTRSFWEYMPEGFPVAKHQTPLRQVSQSYSALDISVEAKEEPAAPQEEDLVLVPQKQELRYIGEVFETYILAASGETLLLIDKHAAHERILFEKLKEADIASARQVLLEPVIVSLSYEEKAALMERQDIALSTGFLLEDFGEREVAVREIPTYFPFGGVARAVEEMAADIAAHNTYSEPEETRWLLHSVACRAAIKAGHKSAPQELMHICDEIFSGRIPLYCPHGRPVYITLTRKELEKRFGRV